MDTTVILAQPRVSRLRADAVYVVCRGSAGAPPGLDRGKAVHRAPDNYLGLLTPSRIGQVLRNLMQKNPLEMRGVYPPNIGQVLVLYCLI